MLKYCKNPCCKKPIEVINRSYNKNGENDYCCRKCYYEFPPAMVKIYYQILKYLNIKKEPQDPKKFMKDVLYGVCQDIDTWTARAACLGVKRQSLQRWCKYLMPELLYKPKKKDLKKIKSL